MRTLQLALAAATAALLLTACGGGGGGSPGGGITTPLPPIPPPPPPPPLPRNSAMDALSVTETFAGFGAGSSVTLSSTQAVTAASQSASAVQVTFDALTGSYTLVAGGRSQSFLPPDLLATDYSGNDYGKTAGGMTDEFALISGSPFGGPAAPAKRFVRLGAWTRASGATFNDDLFVFGVPTPSSSTPRTGAAAYVTDLLGVIAKPGLTLISLNGSGRFDIDFGLGIFKTVTSVYEVDLTTGGTAFGGGVTLTGSGYLDSSGGFSGLITYNNPWNRTASGTLRGGFFGPNAEELGLSFTAAGPGGAVMTGAMTGRRDGALTPSTLSLISVTAETRMRSTFGEVSLYVDTAATPRFRDGIGGLIDTGALITLRPDGSMTFSHSSMTSPPPTLSQSDLSPLQRANFTSYDKLFGGDQVHIEVYKPGPANTELALSYTGFAMWSARYTPATYVIERQQIFTYGLNTEHNLLSQRTGTARYDGVVHGKTMGADEILNYLGGTSHFNVDFGAQTYDGQLVLTAAPVTGGASTGLGTWTFASTLSAGLMTDATLMKDGAPPLFWLVDGNRIKPTFYGPDGEEIGAAFTINVAADGANPRVSHTGAAVAKRR